MLTPVEQMLFILLAVFAVGAAFSGFQEMWNIVNRGEGKLYLDNLPRRAAHALWVYVSQYTTLKTRRLSSLLHLGIVWGFTFYFLVNFADILEGFIPNYRFLGEGNLFSGLYRFGGDVLSIAVLVGVTYFLLRRFVLPNRRELDFHENVLLHPQVQAGAIRTDSLIVGGFILLHVGARFLGQAAQIAHPVEGGLGLFLVGSDFWGEAVGSVLPVIRALDPLRPFASLVSPIFMGLSEDSLTLVEHLTWWLAIGGILLFLPYFPYTKHAHLFMAPLNYLTKPRRTSLGEMQPLDFEDDEVEQFGVKRLQDLPQTHLMDAYACIQCNRCQDVCPAYVTGKELSPSALEINKRYILKDNQAGYAAGEETPILMNFAISESAVWACTACGACIDICPVGNEPMFDILNIRRDAVLMEADFPKELEGAFKGMERQGNPWQIAESRFRWANGLEFPVPTVEENPNFEILYWVGCAASYDPRAQLTARALVKVLHNAGVNFAVLGEMENCTGDSARRAGKEDLYYELATQNVETLNEVKPPRIVVTCPHCFHNIGKEYHQFGGNYEVVHHTQLIDELIDAGRVPMSAHPSRQPNVTFHDPCYLGRHNDIVDEPRDVLGNIGLKLTEMPRNKRGSFCCGAGGAQFWKEEEHGTQAVNVVRYEEAKATGADVVAVGCPFCMQMFTSAQSEVADGPEVKDVVELIAERLPDTKLTVPSIEGS